MYSCSLCEREICYNIKDVRVPPCLWCCPCLARAGGDVYLVRCLHSSFNTDISRVIRMNNNYTSSVNTTTIHIPSLQPQCPFHSNPTPPLPSPRNPRKDRRDREREVISWINNAHSRLHSCWKVNDSWASKLFILDNYIPSPAQTDDWTPRPSLPWVS